MNPYFKGLEEKFAGLGIDVQISETKKTIKIKFEVDTDPHLRFSTEELLLLQPYSLYVKCFSLPDLFAGKMHAVHFRQRQQRVKGRDWFDLEWYLRLGIPLHLDHLAERSRQSGHWPVDQPLDARSMQAFLEDRICGLNIGNARVDVESFIANPQPLEIWSQDYIRQLVQRIQIV